MMPSVLRSKESLVLHGCSFSSLSRPGSSPPPPPASLNFPFRGPFSPPYSRMMALALSLPSAVKARKRIPWRRAQGTPKRNPLRVAAEEGCIKLGACSGFKSSAQLQYTNEVKIDVEKM